MKRKACFFCLLFFILLPLGGCYYTGRTVEGNKITSAQVQEVKLGKTTETELFLLLGPPSKKETKPDGTQTLRYIHTMWLNPTLPGGYVIRGFFDKEEEEIFELILKNGVVQSFQFIRQ